MKKSHIALVSLFSLVTLPVLATDPPVTRKDLGEVKLSAGVGGATPWDASVRYNLTTPKFRLSPFFGIKGINRQSSATDENICHIYQGVMPLSEAESSDYVYLSQEDLHAHGAVLNYGATMGLKLGRADLIEAGIKGENTHRHTLGSRSERILSPRGLISLDPEMRYQAYSVPSAWNGMDDGNTLELTAGYTHSFEGSNWFMLGSKLDVRYSYLRESEDADHLQSVLPGADYKGSRDFQLLANGLSQKHRLQVDLLTPYVTLMPIHIGAYYENRFLRSDDQQWLESVLKLDDHFHHRYQTVGAYLKGDMSVSKLKLNVKLEYAYTRLQNQNLNDFVPEVSAMWSFNKSNSLQASYVRRIIRPSLELLNPAEIRSTYTLSYGNPDLIGAHINNLSLRYQLKRDKADFSATLMHISANDGFNAIWMERGLQCIYTWGNEGKRRAWSLTPDATWRPAKATTLHGRLNVIWDKREAEAIHMAKEHWGFTAAGDLTQALPADILLKVNGEYSRGNTIDLYSHAGHQYSYGASLQRKLIPSGRLVGVLSYTHFDAPKTIITQGAYIGSIYLRAHHKNAGTLTLTYKF